MVLLLTLGKNIAQKKLKMYFPEIALTQVNQHHDLSHQALSGRGYCQKYLSLLSIMIIHLFYVFMNL